MSRAGFRYIGQPAPRIEDERLIRGGGQYLDDLVLPGMLHLAIVRSSAARARLRSIHGDAITAKNLPEGLNALPVLYRPGPPKHLAFPVLAEDSVNYVGEPVAVCLGDSRYAAEDAADAVSVEYELLEPLTDVDASFAGTRLLYQEWGSNVAVHIPVGQRDFTPPAGAVGNVRLTLNFARSQAVPMEGRGVVATWDRFSERLTVWTSTQGPGQFRTVIADALGLEEGQIHVITPDVGGGFGNKLHVFPEDLLACWLARETGRPVKWVEDRREYFVGNVHSRDTKVTIQAWYAANGKVLGLLSTVLVDVGAHLHTKGMGPGALTGRMLPGPYAIPLAKVDVYGCVTNKTPNGAYRGFGQPEATMAIERVMDAVAERVGLDAAEIRRRNLVAEGAFPYTTATGMDLDSGRYHEGLETCLKAFDLDEFRRRQSVARAAGRHLGFGLSVYVEASGFGPTKVLGAIGQNQGGYETAVVRLTPQGDVVVHSGVVDQGQGHPTIMARLVAESLHVDPRRVRLLAGDTDRDPYSGYGTAGSRGTAVGGAAMHLAAERVRLKMERIAAHLLEAAVEDLEWGEGAVWVQGAPNSRLTVRQIAHEAWTGHHLPEGMDPGLEERAYYDPKDWTYTYGVSALEVEVDPGTGVIKIPRYVMLHDAGTLVNPTLAEGQLYGGLVQGIGGTVLEEHVYDEGGQLVTTTFKDYLIPSADQVPQIELLHMETPSPFTPLGMKGLGESGVIAPAPAVLQAVEDALGIRGLTQLPLTPVRLKEALL